MPLLIYPLVVDQLGISEYGRYLTSLATIQLIMFISNLGFDNFYISRKVKTYIPTIVILKSLVFIVIVVVVNLIIPELLLFYFYGVGMFNLILSKAYFQSVDKPGKYVFYTVFTRITILIGVFIIEISVEKYALLVSSAHLFVLLFSFLGYIIAQGSFRILSWVRIKTILIKSSTYFTSEIGVKSYTHLPKIVLGNISPSSLAIYDFYDKIYLFTRLPSQVFFDSFFAEINSYSFRKIKSLFVGYFILILSTTVVIFIALPYIYELYLNESFYWSLAPILFGLLSLVIALNVFIGYGVMQMRLNILQYRKSIFIGMVFFLIILLIMLLIEKITLVNLLFILLTVETIILSYNIKYIIKNGTRLFDSW